MIPIILCGGSGTRLWPISEKKPFYNFFSSYSLLEMCLKRIKDFEPLVIVSVTSLKPSLEKTLRDKKYKTKVIYEPKSKNTAASIALACHLLKKNQESNKNIVGVFPSDHFIDKESKFKKLLSTGIEIAKKEQKIVTFGIPPQSPSSDYGYIKIRDKHRKLNTFSVKQAVGFEEKPQMSTASSLIKEGYLWNSGIFLCPMDILIQYFKKHLSDLWKQILTITEDSNSIHSVYQNIKPISFDKGIMEHIKSYICLPCDVGWSDLGTWDRIADWNQKFPGKLSNRASVIEKRSKENFVFSSKDQSIGLIGIKNSLVINGEEGLLFANRNTGENVKCISEQFKTQKKVELSKPSDCSYKQDKNYSSDDKQKKKWVEKPWGAYRVIMKDGFFKYKELKVKPGHQLSYQSHKKRKEHWFVISGQAEVTLEGNKHQLQTNEHIFIDQEMKHRLKNPTDQILFLLEIQMGSYLEEDDIVRYEDDYGRN